MDWAKQRRRVELDRLGRKAASARARADELKAKGRDAQGAEAEAETAEGAFKRARLVELVGRVREARHEAWSRDPLLDMPGEACAPPDYTVLERDVNRMQISYVDAMLRFYAPEHPKHVWLFIWSRSRFRGPGFVSCRPRHAVKAVDLPA